MGSFLLVIVSRVCSDTQTHVEFMRRVASALRGKHRRNPARAVIVKSASKNIIKKALHPRGTFQVIKLNFRTFWLALAFKLLPTLDIRLLKIRSSRRTGVIMLALMERPISSDGEVIRIIKVAPKIDNFVMSFQLCGSHQMGVKK